MADIFIDFYDDPIRDQAVANVDARHGYTIEHSPNPEAHHAEYGEEEARLRSAHYDGEATA